jgi:hypothetical protein
VATIMRARFTFIPGATGAPLGLFQTFWRPGTSPGSTADATDILARVRAMLQASISALGLNCVYNPITSVDALDDATGAITGSFTGAAPAVVQGTGSGDAMPAQTAYIMRATTNLIVGPRLLKGRTFLGCPGEGQNDPGGKPLSTIVTILNNSFAGLLTGGATASFPVIWHRPSPTAAVPVGTSGPVVGYQCQASYWGSQRGRRF